jgi:hypothetical protein
MRLLLLLLPLGLFAQDSDEIYSVLATSNDYDRYKNSTFYIDEFLTEIPEELYVLATLRCKLRQVIVQHPIVKYKDFIIWGSGDGDYEYLQTIDRKKKKSKEGLYSPLMRFKYEDNNGTLFFSNFESYLNQAYQYVDLGSGFITEQPQFILRQLKKYDIGISSVNPSALYLTKLSPNIYIQDYTYDFLAKNCSLLDSTKVEGVIRKWMKYNERVDERGDEIIEREKKF